MLWDGRREQACDQGHCFQSGSICFGLENDETMGGDLKETSLYHELQACLHSKEGQKTVVAEPIPAN